MAYNIKISCSGPYLSIEDMLRLVFVSNGTDNALKIVKV